MLSIERIQEMLRGVAAPDRLFPATVLYNEGWLLRLILDWFARQATDVHPLSFQSGARWFSEALLPSQFFARNRGDRLAEGWTHADGVIGHVAIGGSALADTQIVDGAKQLLVTEAKLFSRLSSRVTNSGYFDQAARNVACMAEVLSRAKHSPDEMTSLGFFVIAPSEQVSTGIFESAMSKESIREKVARRVSEYSDPMKDQWLREWFLPTLSSARVECLTWERILDYIGSHDSEFGRDLSEFYERCLEFNRLSEREQI